MYRSIVHATRAHYAALQHKPSPDRERLNYSVRNADGAALTQGCVHVKTAGIGRRRAEVTKLTNRLHSMYPEAHTIACAYCDDAQSRLRNHVTGAIERGEKQPIVEMRSFAPEVIADASGQWAGNALRFATRPEAESWVRDLYSRWMLVRETRVVESTDPVNYAWRDGRLEDV